MSLRRNPYFYAFVAILLWSTVSSAFKLSLRHLSPIDLLLWSSISSTVVLFLMVASTKQVHLLKGEGIRPWYRAAIQGFLNPFLYYLILFEAYDRLRAQEAQALNYSWAVVLVLLSIPVLGLRFRWRDIVSVTISFVGVIVVAVQGDFSGFGTSDPVGIGLAVGSSLVWAAYWLMGLRQPGSPILQLTRNFFCGSLMIILLRMLRGGIVAPPLYGFLGAVYVGFFEMGFTFFMWMMALHLSDRPARVANLIYVTPFLSLGIIYLSLGETITLPTIGGLSLIIAGVLAQQTTQTRTPKNESSPEGGTDNNQSSHI